MADVKFSELNALSAADVASDDIFAIVDTSASTSKKLTIDSLFGSIPVDAKITDTTNSTSNTSGALIVSGGVGIAKSVTIGENLTVHGDTTISGNLTFGDAASDKVTFTADIRSSLTPVANVTYDIGTAAFHWSNVYSNNITTTAYTQNSTSILMNTTNKMYFHDTGLSIQSATDGTLDIAADAILEITAPTTNVIATTALTIHTPAITANGTVTIGADNTGYDVIFYTATAGNRWWIDEDADTMYANVTSVFGGNITVGVDDAGHDVTFYGATASSNMLWDMSDDQMEFGNAFITMSDARTSGTASRTGITVDIYNKYDSGSSYDTIGAAISTIGDTNGYTIRDCVAIRATSKNSTGSEVTRLNTPAHLVLDLANTASANHTGTTLSGAYGLVIDHDDTVATRTGQPTAFISFGEMYAGGTASIETAYLFDIFPEGKTGDATYETAADIAFYDDAAIIAAERDAVILNSTDGSPGTDAGDLIVLETMDGDAYTPSRILEESHTDVELNDGMPNQENYIVMEAEPDSSTPYIMLDTNVAEALDETEGGKIIFEDTTQSADGTIKIRINGEDKYIQVYNSY